MKGKIGMHPKTLMQNNLFAETKETYELFDSIRYRVILRFELTADEAERSNVYFIESLCPHLAFRKAKSKVYRISK